MSRRGVHAKHRATRNAVQLETDDDDPVEALIRRSKRQLRRGHVREAVVLLQRACSLDEWRARSFTLLGALFQKMGRNEDAERAWLHARWLRQRAGELLRAEVTTQLIGRLRMSRGALH